MEYDFDEEERITTGIEELDSMLHGGVLQNQVIVIAGPAGGGKTIAALQFIHANLVQGKRCMYVSASDDERSITKHARGFGWDFTPFLDEGKISIVNMKLVEVEHGLASDFLQQLPKIIRNAKPEVIAVDSITEFNDLCSTELERRGRLMDLRWVIKDTGATGIMTAETAPDGYTTKYGIAEYVADGLILLSRYQSEEISEYLHVLQILKMRWADHSKELRAYAITNHGIEIQSPLYTTMAATGKRKV